MDVLDVVANVSNRATAMALLKSIPKASPVLRRRFFDVVDGFDFTFADVQELVECRRPDLAALVLASTRDVSVLREAAKASLPVALLKAVCENRSVSADVLALLYMHSRKGVSAAARSALAYRFGILVKFTDPVATQFCHLVFGPEKTVARTLAGLLQQIPTRGTAFLVSAALDRPGGVSDETWAVISANDWMLINSRSPSTLTSRLAVHPRMSVADLESVLRRTKGFAGAYPVMDALLDRLDPSEKRWLDLLLDRAATPNMEKLSAHAVRMTTEQAQKFLRSGRPLHVRVALCSGRLPEDELRELVFEWASPGGPKGTPPSHLLESDLVDGELLRLCFSAYGVDQEVFSRLESNPNLTAEMQWTLLGMQHVHTGLAGNPKLTREAASELVRLAAEAVSASEVSNARAMPWLVRPMVSALLANEHIDPDVRLSVPAGVLPWVRHEHQQPHAYHAVVTLIDQELGGDLEAWKMLLGLLPEWEGSVADLITVSTSI